MSKTIIRDEARAEYEAKACLQRVTEDEQIKLALDILRRRLGKRGAALESPAAVSA